MVLIFDFESAIIVPFFPSFSPYTRQQFILNHNRDFPTHGLHHDGHSVTKITLPAQSQDKAGGLYLHCHISLADFLSPQQPFCTTSHQITSQIIHVHRKSFRVKETRMRFGDEFVNFFGHGSSCNQKEEILHRLQCLT